MFWLIYCIITMLQYGNLLNTKLNLFIYTYFIAQSYLLCYQCVSTHPGCGTPFKWLWHKTVSCPEEDDICVKVIEKVGGNDLQFMLEITKIN